MIRPSGTEPVVRVMAEGEDPERVAEVVETIVARMETTAAGAAAG